MIRRTAYILNAIFCNNTSDSIFSFIVMTFKTDFINNFGICQDLRIFWSFPFILFAFLLRSLIFYSDFMMTGLIKWTLLLLLAGILFLTEAEEVTDEATWPD